MEREWVEGRRGGVDGRSAGVGRGRGRGAPGGVGPRQAADRGFGGHGWPADTRPGVRRARMASGRPRPGFGGHGWPADTRPGFGGHGWPADTRPGFGGHRWPAHSERWTRRYRRAEPRTTAGGWPATATRPGFRGQLGGRTKTAGKRCAPPVWARAESPSTMPLGGKRGAGSLPTGTLGPASAAAGRARPPRSAFPKMASAAHLGYTFQRRPSPICKRPGTRSGHPYRTERNRSELSGNHWAGADVLRVPPRDSQKLSMHMPAKEPISWE